MSDPRLQPLYQTLDNYLKAVPRQQEPNPPDLLALFQQLEANEQEVQPFASPELKHYLHKKSYRKAFDYLRENDEKESVR